MKEVKKQARKLLSVVMAAVLVLSLSAVTAFAASNTGTITINNASKGETYKVYKLFDATVTGTENGSIAYTGTIPKGLGDYFTKDSVGNISAVENVDQVALFAALKTWAEDRTPDAFAKSDGSTLEFTGLSYGYYVVTTTQGDTAITVTSTNPNATIYDKNTTTPTPPDGEEGIKKVDGTDVSIGDMVTYTVTFKSSNFEGADESAKRILSYTITDTLPDFLDNCTVTSITIGGAAYKVNDATPQFDEDGKIVIPWVDADKNSLYGNGAVVAITYTATINGKIEVGGRRDANKNTVTIKWNVDDGTTPGGSESEKSLTDEEVVSTYAAAIQKVDENDANLAGAKFSIKGLTVAGSKGNYKVVSYDPSETAAAGTEMEGDDNGLIVISGIASDETLVATETVAPNGYNKLVGTVGVKPVKTSETVTTTTTTTKTYYDADGNVTDEQHAVTTETVTTVTGAEKVTPVEIENRKGSLLPTTGGMGTTVLYVIGGLLVVGAGVALVVRRRMNAGE